MFNLTYGNNDFQNDLQIALISNDLELVRKLSKNIKNLDEKNGSEENAIQMVVGTNTGYDPLRLEKVKVLLAAGAVMEDQQCWFKEVKGIFDLVKMSDSLFYESSINISNSNKDFIKELSNIEDSDTKEVIANRLVNMLLYRTKHEDINKLEEVLNKLIVSFQEFSDKGYDLSYMSNKISLVLNNNGNVLASISDRTNAIITSNTVPLSDIEELSEALRELDTNSNDLNSNLMGTE